MEKGNIETPLKVFQVIQSLEIGGAENFTCQLSNELSKNNDITLLTTKKYDSNPNFDKILNSNIKHLNLSWTKKYSILQFVELLKLIRFHKPDVVHVHLHNSFYYVFACAIFKKNLNYIHTIHSSFEVWEPIFKIIYKLRLLNNKIIHVALSKSIEDKFKKNFKKINVTKISNGISPLLQSQTSNLETNNFMKSISHQEDSSNTLLIAIGNIATFKNYVLLAKALKQINNKNIKCVIIGKHASPELVDEIKSVNCENLQLVGFKENAAQYLYIADALVISSLQEGMPLVALEAMSVGVPIISTPVGALPELIKHNETGILSKDNSIIEFSNALKYFINLTNIERKKMGSLARERFLKEYSIERTAMNYNNLYRNGLDTR
ncbi:MAG: glycosyltransferase family 4 protein [Bacteroidota bacterium]